MINVWVGEVTAIYTITPEEMAAKATPKAVTSAGRKSWPSYLFLPE